MPASKGGLRPHRSERGPYTSCPAPNPRKKALSVNWTHLALAPKLSASVGKAGRYMSMDIGPKAVRAARKRVNPTPPTRPRCGSRRELVAGPAGVGAGGGSGFEMGSSLLGRPQ